MTKQNKRPYVDFNDKASEGDTWHAQLFVSKGEGGRPNFSLPKSEATLKQFLDAAHAHAVKLRTQRGKGRTSVAIDGNMLMRDLAAQVIASRNVGGSKTGEPVRDRTKRIYLDAWRLWIGPVMGDMKVKQVNCANVVEDRLAMIRSRGGQDGKVLSQGTLYQVSRAVSIVLDAMCRGGRFEFQELKMIDFFAKPDAKIKRKQVFMDATHFVTAHAKMTKLLDKVRFWLGAAVGLRPGEMTALKWTDLKPSTEAGVWMEITINATMTTDFNRKSIFQDTTKSTAGLRTYYVPTGWEAFLGPLLFAWKDEQMSIRRERSLETDSHGWFVMSNREGSQGSEGNMRSWFKSMIAQGILPEGYTPHNLRHTFGTHFAGANGGVTTALATIMGHADVKTAQDFYVGAVKSDQVEQGEKHATRLLGFLKAA